MCVYMSLALLHDRTRVQLHHSTRPHALAGKMRARASSVQALNDRTQQAAHGQIVPCWAIGGLNTGGSTT